MRQFAGLSLVLTLVSAQTAFGEDWPQWLGAQRDSVWHETGILEKFPEKGPTIRWRTPIGGGYAGPAVAQGKVYVVDRTLAEGVKQPSDQFKKDALPGKERVLCLNEADGAIIWKQEYDCEYAISYPCGPRAVPLVAGGKVYTLGAEGNLCCFDAEKGTPVWSHELKKDYKAKTPLWGFSSSLLLEGKNLICMVGAPQASVISFDKDSGKELWKNLSFVELGYSTPEVFDFGGKREVVVWEPAAIHSLEPDTGKEIWEQKFTTQKGMVITTPRKLGELLFVSCFFNGPMMVKVAADKPAVAWRGESSIESKPDKIHCVMSTPFLENGYIYGTCSYGHLRCLKADTGERVWESLDYLAGKPVRWGTAFIVKNGDRFFLATELGDLIIAKLTPKGYEELSRTHLLEPTGDAAGHAVVWSHPAFADKCVFARNDKELVCASLAAEK
jgi:outer membrane protein assembly factor BamB